MRAITTLLSLTAVLLLGAPLLGGCEASPVDAERIEQADLEQPEPSPQPNEPAAEGAEQPTAQADQAAAPGTCCGTGNCGADGKGCQGGCGCGR